MCTLAWVFDCLNQQIFNLTRKPAMADLLATSPGDPAVALYGSLSTSALLIGWATGGIVFGILGDRIGRVKTLVIMILCYSVSTGLCGLSVRAVGLHSLLLHYRRGGGGHLSRWLHAGGRKPAGPHPPASLGNAAGLLRLWQHQRRTDLPCS